MLAGPLHDAKRRVLGLTAGLTLTLAVAPARAEVSGGFVEKAESLAIRGPWTAAEMQAFLPARGRFTFPAPYGTEGIRITNGADCAGSDCVASVAVNNHRDSATMLVLVGLRGVGPTLFSVDKAKERVRNLGPLFDAGSPYAASSGEGWYWSATRPTSLYLGRGSSKLQRYDVLTRTLETVFDVAPRFGSDRFIDEARSSDDDRVHSVVLRDSASGAGLGCVAFRESNRQLSYYGARRRMDQCQVDRSGRWLVMTDDVDGIAGNDTRILDVETGEERLLLAQDGGGGVFDTGRGYMIAADRFNPLPGALRVFGLGEGRLQGTLVHREAYAGAGVAPIVHSDPSMDEAPRPAYACGIGASSQPAVRASEVVCFRLDGSEDVLVVTQAMTGSPTPSGVSRNGNRLPGTLDVTGGYFLWTGRVDGLRSDAFLVKVPAERLTGPVSAPPSLTPPAVTEVLDAPPSAVTASLPNPALLPVATIAQAPLTVAYNLLNVPAKAAGSFYLDPTTGVKIYKLTSGTFPTSGTNWGHDYSEGGDEVSLPYNGTTRAILVYSGSSHWLIDFTPGVGVSNPRALTGNLSPWIDLAFAFSNNPATPYYAYVVNGTTIRRIDIRTLSEAPGNGWPITDLPSPDGYGPTWLHQAENDSFFTWMRGANGPTVVGYQPSTGTLKTYTNSGLNEPRIDRGGRYVGISMGTPYNGLVVWDWQTNAVSWTTPGDPGPPFAHNASLKRRWLTVDWNLSFPDQFVMYSSDTPNSATHIGGPANGTEIHCNGNWIQSPADLNDQWALCTHYGSLQPTGSTWLAPGAMVLLTPNGQRRILAHPYNTTSNYTFYSFAKFASDGQYVLFTSNMNGAARSDLFLAEVPGTLALPDTTPPTVSISAPAGGATVSGGALVVSANAADDVGVVGVQFKLDGSNLGTEATAAPYAVSWNTTLTANGSHTLTAVARDAAGNSTVSAGVAVTVSNVASGPLISAVASSGLSTSDATITWTTDRSSDTQVDYGITSGYGSSTSLNTSMVVAHTQALGGLASGTLYHYRVKSRDAAGTQTASGDFTLTTLPALSQGLLAYLRFDEGSGTTVADASGSGNGGSLVNGAGWTAGTGGQAAALDGIDDYVSIPHAAALDAFPLSLTVWFRTSATAGVSGLVNKYVAGSYDGYQVFFTNGDLCAWYLRDTGNYVYDGGACPMRTSGYNDGLWHQAAFVVDAAGGRLYVDGVAKGTQPWTGQSGPPTTVQDVQLGHYPGASGGVEYLPGAVDELRIYGRALSAGEVLQIYNDSRPVGDLTPPVISAVAAGGVGGTGATISWITNEAADSQIEYGATTAYGSATATNPSLVLSHSQALAALTPGSLYHYRVKSRDAAGNLAVSSDSTFATLDTLPPVASLTAPLSGQTVSGSVVATASASDNVGVVGVQFKLDGSNLGTELASPPYSLSWNTTGTSDGPHVLTVVARDSAGNSTTAASVSVTVSNNPAPTISAVSASGISSSAATIAWTTNVTADSQVEYGPTASYGSSTTLNTGLVLSHAQALSGLAAGTLYHYRVKSRSGAGTLAVSPDFTFTTLTGADPSLIAYLKFDEGTGTTAADASGHGNKGTLTNGATWTTGRSGQAAAVDGVNDYVRMAHAASLDAFPLTAAVWFKTTATTGVRGLLNKYVSGSYNGYQIFLNGGKLCAWYLRNTSNYVYDGGGCTLSTAGYNDGLWHQAVFVVDASGGRLYVDGVQKGSRAWTGTAAAPTTTQEIRLGHYPGAPGSTAYLPGAVDALRIYNRALSATEVLQVYNGQP